MQWNISYTCLVNFIMVLFQNTKNVTENHLNEYKSVDLIVCILTALFRSDQSKKSDVHLNLIGVGFRNGWSFYQWNL